MLEAAANIPLAAAAQRLTIKSEPQTLAGRLCIRMR